MSRNSLSVEIAGRKISGAFYNWLAEEVKTSGVDNTYLDDFIEARRRLTLGYDSEENWSAKKQEGHLNRLEKIWWPEEFMENPLNDESSAKILFGALMFVSGAYRIQSYIQSKTPREYDDRRRKAIGINPHRVVANHLATILPPSGNFSHAALSVESQDEFSLGYRMHYTVAKIGETTIKNVCDNLELGKDLGVEHSPSVDETMKAQIGWLEFATDCVAVAAKLRRGELAAVPFLEPKSISARPAPKVIYPLAA